MMLQKEYKKAQRSFRNELLMYFDELNSLQMTRSYKKALKDKYSKYKCKNDLVRYYWMYLLSLPTNEDILIELGILQRVDSLYSDYDIINTGTSVLFERNGYDECLKDIGKKTHKRKFSPRNDFQYVGNKVIADTQKIKKQAILERRKGKIKVNTKILDRMNKEWLNIHDGKFSGYMERQSELAYNVGYLGACEDYGIEEVQFISVMDKKTTKMCHSLDGQVFKLHGLNKFTRYYASMNGAKYTEVEGLVQGINLPPIDDAFHWCRSTIVALKN